MLDGVPHQHPAAGQCIKESDKDEGLCVSEAREINDIPEVSHLTPITCVQIALLGLATHSDQQQTQNGCVLAAPAITVWLYVFICCL